MSNQAKIREAAKRLNPIDDLMFRKMAEEPRFCEEILRIFLSDPELVVLEVIPQYVGTNLQGRSVILDARCILGSGWLVDIEVQKADDDDHQRRMRYNGAVLTANILDPGTKFRDVPDVCGVFLSRFDLFGSGHALDHVDRMAREAGRVAEDGFAEVYVNAKVKDGSAAAELMDVFTRDDAYSDRFPITSMCKWRYKETEEGQRIMCEIMAKIAEEERQEGRQEGEMLVSRMNEILIETGRLEDLKRAAKDGAYRAGLMRELLPDAGLF